MKLTILIPIYNTEKYLPECLDSLISQSFSDFEVICINDGSTDRSLKIIKNYQSKDSRIKLLDKKNTGYGDSLNQGITLAKGEYIGIIEPDDFVHPNMYNQLISLADKHRVDIVKASYFNYFSDKTPLPEKLFPSYFVDRIVDPSAESELFLTYPTIWSAIYRRELISKLLPDCFLSTPGASYQDISFAFKTFALSKRVYCSNFPLYYYRRDNNSSSVKDRNKVFIVKHEFDQLEKFLSSSGSLKKFIPIATVCRFRSYLWNLDRLKTFNARRFAKVARQDFLRLNSSFRSGLSQLKPFSRKLDLCISASFPSSYVFLKPLFSLKNFCLRSLSRFCHLIKKR